MKDYLFNLALVDTVEFCKRNRIDCSGTHLVKYPKQQIYTLIRDEDSMAVVTVQFYKNRVPNHTIHTK